MFLEQEITNQYKIFETWLNNQVLPDNADKGLIELYAWQNTFDVEVSEMANCAISTVLNFLDQEPEYPYLFNKEL